MRPTQIKPGWVMHKHAEPGQSTTTRLASMGYSEARERLSVQHMGNGGKPVTKTRTKLIQALRKLKASGQIVEPLDEAFR